MSTASARKASAPATPATPASAIVSATPATPATAPDAFGGAFGFPSEGTPSVYVSPKFGKVNLRPRGNLLFSAYLLSVGIRGDVIPFSNPNREGRGQCIDYASKSYAGAIESINGFYRIADPDVRAALYAYSVAALGGEAGAEALKARVYRDFVECSPNRKAGRRAGTLP
jgi:hypothetical protein